MRHTNVGEYYRDVLAQVERELDRARESRDAFDKESEPLDYWYYHGMRAGLQEALRILSQSLTQPIETENP